MGFIKEKRKKKVRKRKEKVKEDKKERCNYNKKVFEGNKKV